MSFVHGKSTVVIVNGSDVSTYTNTSTFTRGADEHDVTTYGKDDHVVQGGLGTGGFTMGGTYDNTATGTPRAVLEPIIGTVVTVVRRPEGTGSGKPQQSFSAHVKSYVETNPVADYVSWSAEFTKSGAVTRTTQ